MKQTELAPSNNTVVSITLQVLTRDVAVVVSELIVAILFSKVRQLVKWNFTHCADR